MHAVHGAAARHAFRVEKSASQFPGNLLHGYRTDGFTRFNSFSYAAFGEATWHVTDALSVTGGIRYTYEDKDGSFSSTVAVHNTRVFPNSTRAEPSAHSTKCGVIRTSRI